MTTEDVKTFLCMVCAYKFYRKTNGTPRRCPMCREYLCNPQPTPDGTIMLFEKKLEPKK